MNKSVKKKQEDRDIEVKDHLLYCWVKQEHAVSRAGGESAHSQETEPHGAAPGSTTEITRTCRANLQPEI